MQSMNKKNLQFHIISDDYFGTLATTIDLLRQAIVKGGVQNSVGTVTLTGIAPVGDLVVTLSSNDVTSATVPVTVTVPAGSKTATFPVTSQIVSIQKKPVITATTGIVNKIATLTVNP